VLEEKDLREPLFKAGAEVRLNAVAWKRDAVEMVLPF